MALFDGLITDKDSNIYFANDMDICDICLSKEMKKEENQKKAMYEVRKEMQGLLNGEKIAKIRNASNTLTIICKKCSQELYDKLHSEKTSQASEEPEKPEEQKKRGPKPKKE